MEKTIGASEAGRSFGKILNEITARQDKFVVERHGQAVAAVVPIEIYNQWKRQREAFFAKLRETSEQTNLTPAAADLLAEEAVQAVRKKPSL